MKKIHKIKNIFIALFSFLFIACLGVGGVSYRPTDVNAQESEERTQAYVIYEDRETRGFWYTGYKGTKEYAQNRVYGKEGVVLTTHGEVQDGRPTGGHIYNWSGYKENMPGWEDNHENWSGNTLDINKLHYVEYPEYVSSMSLSGTDIGYHNNSQLTVREMGQSAQTHGWGLFKRLMYIDLKDRPGNPQGKNGTAGLDGANIQVTVNFTDEEWHIVTLYLGWMYMGVLDYYETALNVYDLQGNKVMSTIVEDPNTSGCYVSLAIKGSCILELDKNGYYACNLGGIFFDKFIDNTEVGWSNLQATLEPPKAVHLSWENTTDASVTNIYRRKKGESAFTYLATVGAGVNTYADTDTKVNTEYEYTLISGERRVFDSATASEWDPYTFTYQNYEKFKFTPDVIDFNMMTPENYTSCKTAPFISSYIEFEQDNLGCELGKTLYANVKVYKNTVYDENGNVIDKGEPYPNVSVNFTLGGENATSFINGTYYPNMNTDIYSCYTNAKGIGQLVYKPEYAGEYAITAEIAVIPDEKDVTGMSGIDGYSETQDFVVYQIAEDYVPTLYTITDAIKPGGAFTITGNGISVGGVTKIAYAPYNGESKREFNESIAGLKYISGSDVIVDDIDYNCGVTAIFPKTADAGIYDIWIKNVYGWSKAITMNEVRGLYMNVDGGYAGLPIEIIGRNFFGSEYGMNSITEKNVRVKLVRIGNINGQSDGVTCTKILPINQGVKWTASETFVGKDIAISNPFRIEFTVPDIPTGQYTVYVSSDGIAYRQVESSQTLTIYEKKTVSYSTAHFSPKADMIGNDPLDLNVFWAQNYKWNSIDTIDSQYIYAEPTYNFDADAAEDGRFTISTSGNGKEVAIENAGNPTQRTIITKHVQSKIDALSQAGGGVLYFPKGYYYLGSITLKSNVVLLGESVEDTVLIATFTAIELNTQSFILWQKTQNCGIARMTLTQYKKELERTPNFYILGEDNTNLFMTDLYLDLFQPEEFINRNYNRGMCTYYHSHNFVYQNVVYRGDYTPLYLADMPITRISHHVIIRNIDIKMTYGHVDMGYNYTTVENTKLVSGSEGHGWTGKNNSYCAYNLVQDIGRKVKCDNQGESFYYEPPSSISSVGKILGATERSFAVKVTGGERVSELTELGYTQCAVMITNGKGIGQLRYFDIKPINGYGNEYQLCDYEEDWDIIPDETSQFTIFEPLSKNTLYNNVVKDCAKSMMFFGMANDCVMYGNTSINSEGIQVWGCANQNQTTGNILCRIENNVLTGIASGTGSGGIEIMAGDYTEDAGVISLGMTIRNNQLYDMRNPEYFSGSSEFGEYRGISINSISYKEDAGRISAIRHVLIEGNYVENCDYGVRADAQTYGICLKDNTFKMIGVEGLGLEETGLALDYDPVGGYAEDYITLLFAKNVKGVNNLYFVEDGKTNNVLSGRYSFQEMLPSLDGSFVGWSYEDKDMTAYTRGDIVTSNEGSIATLYPVYGYSISLRYNYERTDGKAEYRNTIYLWSENPESLGKPVRVGYTFGGWYYDSACTQAYDANAEIEEDLILYAKWTSKNGEVEDTPPLVADDEKDNNSTLWIIIGCVAATIVVGAGIVVAMKKKR